MCVYIYIYLHIYIYLNWCIYIYKNTYKDTPRHMSHPVSDKASRTIWDLAAHPISGHRQYKALDSECAHSRNHTPL